MDRGPEQCTASNNLLKGASERGVSRRASIAIDTVLRWEQGTRTQLRDCARGESGVGPPGQVASRQQREREREKHFWSYMLSYVIFVIVSCLRENPPQPNHKTCTNRGGRPVTATSSRYWSIIFTRNGCHLKRRSRPAKQVTSVRQLSPYIMVPLFSLSYLLMYAVCTLGLPLFVLISDLFYDSIPGG